MPGWRRAVGAVVLFVMAAVGPAFAQDEVEVNLKVVGRSDLGGTGLDGDIAVVGNTAVVGTGVAPTSPSHVERYGAVPCVPSVLKVVNVKDPRKPEVVATVSQPAGLAVVDVDALQVITPAFTGDLVAVALEWTGGCPAPTAAGGVAFYDVTIPAAPVLLGTYGGGQHHSVALAQREDGRVLSLSVEAALGTVHVVEVTEPASPRLLSTWLPAAGESPAPRGCVAAVTPHAAQFREGGEWAVVASMDAGVHQLDLADPAVPLAAGQFQYGSEGEGEGNAAFATPVDLNDETLVLLSEEDWHAPATVLEVDGIGPLTVCQPLPALFDGAGRAPVFAQPGGRLTAEVTIAGPGCPGTPLTADVRDRIAVLTPTRGPCGDEERVLRVAEAGAVSVVLQGPVSGAGLGVPPVPVVVIDAAGAAALRPGITASLVDTPGTWGGLRLLSLDPEGGFRDVRTLHSPRAAAFPPPDSGVYAPGRSVTSGQQAVVAWHAEGVRVLDLGANPVKAIGQFVPAVTPDPTGTVAATVDVVGVALLADFILVTDTNSGLYVLERPDEGRAGSFWDELPMVLAALSLAGLVAMIMVPKMMVARSLGGAVARRPTAVGQAARRR